MLTAARGPESRASSAPPAPPAESASAELEPLRRRIQRRFDVPLEGDRRRTEHHPVASRLQADTKRLARRNVADRAHQRHHRQLDRARLPALLEVDAQTRPVATRDVRELGIEPGGDPLGQLAQESTVRVAQLTKHQGGNQ